MPDKELIHTDASTPRKTTANGGNDPVQKAKDEATIALETQKAEFARQNVKDLNELKEQQKKLIADQQSLSQEREKWEKQKEDWLESFDTQKATEIEKIRKVKEYWDSKKSTIENLEKSIISRETVLSNKQTTLDNQEKRVDLLMSGLDERVELKKKQIVELQDIIDNKAPQYHKLFKQMLSQGEVKRDWNYNAARGDQWHNFTERVSIIYHSLHEMLFG